MSSRRLLLITILAICPALALGGKAMDVCRDAKGNAYFSDRGCPEDTVRQGRDYVPSAQNYGGEPSPDNRVFIYREQTRGADPASGWRRDPAEER